LDLSIRFSVITGGLGTSGGEGGTFGP